LQFEDPLDNVLCPKSSWLDLLTARGIMHTLVQQIFDLGTAEEAEGGLIRGDR